jgi:putative endonuclease
VKDSSKSRLLLGKKGEEKALRYLSSKGYRILHTNLKLPQGEIDIVARKGKLTALIEVRSRISPHIDPFETVTAKKKNKLKSLARYYCEFYDGESDIRLDVIGITFHNDDAVIEHIENAFDLL